MAVPKSRHTKSRRNKRRAGHYITAPAFSVCGNCGKEVLSHTVCKNCGYYGKRRIINVLEKLTKKERKKREKEIDAKKEAENKGLSMEELSRK